MAVDHPSCSKQHAVLQFKQKVKESAMDGSLSAKVRPYIIDLGSTNGWQKPASYFRFQSFYFF